MFDVIKFTLQFLCAYFGLAIWVTIVWFRAENNQQNDPDDDEGDGDEDAVDPDVGDPDLGDADNASDNVAQDGNNNDNASEWSDSSSIDRAFEQAYILSQVLKA